MRVFGATGDGGGGEWDLGDDAVGPGMADALFTATQRRVLGLLFDGRGAAYSVGEVIRLTGAGSGAVQRELARLVACGLVRVGQGARQKRYSADAEGPIHAELAGIVRKTFGVATPLRAALAPLADRITFAVAWEAGADIDLLIASDWLAYGDVYAALEPLMDALSRRIVPSIHTSCALMTKACRWDPLVRRLASPSTPALWLQGRDTLVARLLA